MNISSRTPEGQPDQCPLCSKFLRIEPSHPTNDAPCPHCGHLLFFVRDPDDSAVAYFYTKEYQPDDIPDHILQSVPLSICLEHNLVPVDETVNSLVIASLRPLPTENIEILSFIINRSLTNVLMPMDTFERLLKRYEKRYEQLFPHEKSSLEQLEDFGFQQGTASPIKAKWPPIVIWVWLFSWITASIVSFVFAAKEFSAGNQVRQRVLDSGRSLDEVPQTMLGEHPAMGVALICIGLICLLAAFRKSTIYFRLK